MYLVWCLILGIHPPLLYFSWPYCHGCTLFFIYCKYKFSFFLLGFVFVYFFCCPYIMSIRENRPNIFYRLERWGSRHIGPLAPVPLFEICSLFTPHLNWQSRIRLFFLNCYSRPFTNTAAILNKLDLRSIMGCPGGHEHNPFFFKFSKHKIVMGKKIVVPCLATSFPGFSPNHPTGRADRREPWERGFHVWLPFSREIYSERLYFNWSCSCPHNTL